MLTLFSVGFPVLAVSILGIAETVLHRFPALERNLLRIMRFPPL